MFTFFTQKNITRVCAVPRLGGSGFCALITASDKPFAELELWTLPTSGLEDTISPASQRKFRLLSRATDIKYLSSLKPNYPDTVLVSTYSGHIYAFSLAVDQIGFSDPMREIASVKATNGPVTSIDIHPGLGHILAVGEDGSVSLFDSENFQRLHHVTRATESALQSCKFISDTNFVTASTSTQINIWDVRVNNVIPVATLREESTLTARAVATSSIRSVYSLDVHQQRPHIVCSGTSGDPLSPAAVMLHDVRLISSAANRGSAPIYYATMHTGHVGLVKLHPDSPDTLLSCSDDGSLLMWDLAPVSQSTTMELPSRARDAERVRIRKLFNSSLPVNTFTIDAGNNLLISACEDESLTVHTNLLIM